MFVDGPSPIALLHAAASECRLPYASLITEIADNSTILCGVELWAIISNFRYLRQVKFREIRTSFNLTLQANGKTKQFFRYIFQYFSN